MQDLWSWLGTNHGKISAIANVLTVMIWALYLHLFLSSFRRHRRPKILINRGGGTSLGAHCIVSNMSEMPIYIETVVIRTHSGDKADDCRLSDLDEEECSSTDQRPQWFQGPLPEGGLLDLGPYRRLLNMAGGKDAAGEGDAHQTGGVTVIVVATCVSDGRLVGARRDFELQPPEAGRQRLLATSPYTAQLRSSGRGDFLERLLEEPRIREAEPR